MIICPICDKENEDFFKFCLGCGADLKGALPLDEGATVEKEKQGSRVGDPSTRRANDPESLRSSRGLRRTCRMCGASQDPSFAFCADCGTSFAELRKTPEASSSHTPAPPRSGVVKGRLVLVREDGSDGESFALDAAGTVIGREEGHITFPEDDFLATEHLELTYEDEALVVHPRPSTNGVYVRVFDETHLVAGDRIRIGQELLEYVSFRAEHEAGEPDREGTLPLGSPIAKDAWGQLIQLLGPEQAGEAFILRGREVYIGRERGDIRFPLDGYVSGSHAVVSRSSEGPTLRDLGSSNGTFVRLRTRRAIRQGDFMLVGQQLLRFEP